MANYLVAGAAGFIGSRVSELLMEDGHGVVGIDNLNDAYDVRMKHWRLERLQRQGTEMGGQFAFYPVELADRQAVATGGFELGGKAVNFEGIINLAARAGVRPSVENPWVYVDTNVTGTLNLLEYAQAHAVPKFILASTSSIYGPNAVLPTPEESDSDHPLQPYAATKKGAEALCHAYHAMYGIDITIFRYFTVYGPAGRPDMSLFRFTQWIREGRPLRLNGDGEQTRGFTYVDDIARGTILGLKRLGDEVINLGGHETISMNGVIQMLEELIGRKAQVMRLPANPADMLANWANVEKARRLLGWEPRVGLRAGMTNLVNWYETERSWASQIKTD